MKLTLSLSPNPSLSQKFPLDPDHDLTILCGDLTFKLQIAFLYLQSKYFDDIDHQHITSLDLSYLQQNPLSQALLLLYGGEIVIESMRELSELFTVVVFLKMESVRDIIVSEIRENLEEWNGVELLQLSYEHNILKQQVLQLNLANDLSILQDPKHTMQLSKLSPKTISLILIDYFQKTRNPQTQQSLRSNINGILSDYFHTNKIKPEEYWKENNADLLQWIWYQFHPVYYRTGMEFSGGSKGSEKAKRVKEIEERVGELKGVVKERERRILELVKANEEINEKLKGSKRKQRAVTQGVYLQVPNIIYKPPSIPISPTSSMGMKDREVFTIQDEEYQANKMNNINLMKAKQGINRIHTRNQSRGKE